MSQKIVFLRVMNMNEFIEIFLKFWKHLWSILGPIFFVLFILLLYYIRNPEPFEKIAIHISWILSRVSRYFEKRAISREVRYIVSSSFSKNFPIEEVPEIVIEWGDEDRAIRDIKSGKLVIILKSGRRNRYENIARALLATVPELLAPEMKAVYDEKLLKCLSAHIAKSIAKDYPQVVTMINEAIRDTIANDDKMLKVSSTLVEIDDQSLFSRVLVPELIEIAKLRYPHRDPALDEEVLELIDMLGKLSRGEKVDFPLIYRKYIRLAFIRVARPEKIEAMLEPHIRFVKHILSKYRGIKSLYILAAGRNIAAAKALRMLLENEFKNIGIRFDVQEHVYEGIYKGVPKIKLYVGRIRIFS